MLATRSYSGSDTYRAGNGWFICDRCSQRHRRSGMLTEWTGLKVDAKCLDPRPPQMQPPDVYPEGIPFFDARPPGDRPDRLEDDTSLRSIMGGIEALVGGALVQPDFDLRDSDNAPVLDSDGNPILVDPENIPVSQYTPPGAISPLPVQETPLPYGPDVLADDVTFITGPVAAPSNED